MATANLSYDELSFSSRLNVYLIRDISQGGRKRWLAKLIFFNMEI